MKILSRILVTLFVLLGVAFLVMLSRAYAAGKVKCDGSYELRLALDENGCETKEPLHATEKQIDEWLKKAGVSKECYKIRFWKDHHLDKEIGDLDLVECVANESAKSKKIKTLQRTGGGGTQRVMFNTPVAREAFERKTKAAKP